jgi:acyl-coenzyme A synthetase/AMP-(fatty) acid ligase
MVPTDVWLVSELPRTSSGKIDRVRTRAAIVEGTLSPAQRGEARVLAREQEKDPG